MLSYIDRIQLVVPDRDEAVARWKALFDADFVGEDQSPLLGAKRTTVRAGATEFELLEAHDPGRISRFSAAWRSGLYGVGFSTPDLDEMARHFDKLDIAYREEDGRLYLAEEMTHGMPTVVSADGSREIGRAHV